MVETLKESAHKAEANLFWQEWLGADELRRLKMVKTLPIFNKGKPDYKRLTATLLNSYFEDLEKEIARGKV